MQGASQRPECPFPPALPSQTEPSCSTCGQDRPAILHCHPGEGGVSQAWVLPRRAGKGGTETKTSLTVHEKGTNGTSWHSLSSFSFCSSTPRTRRALFMQQLLWVTQALLHPPLSCPWAFPGTLPFPAILSRWWLSPNRGTVATALTLFL